ncbi:MAG TPA: type I polyketide synthase, partial [Streptosporangiaceae bacterium]
RDRTEAWRYRITWAPVPEPDPAPLAGTWLVVTGPGPAAGLAGGIRRALEARGARVVPLSTATHDTERPHLRALLTTLPVAPEDVTGVISLLALDETPLAGHRVVPAGLAGTLALVQALGDAGMDAPLWLLTRGAVAAEPDEVLASPVQGQVWGLGRVAGAEYRDRWGGLVDLPPDFDDQAAGRLCAVLAGGGLAGAGEDQVAIRSTGIAARRLARAPLPRELRPWTPGGTVLVTGGTGAIGGHVAGWLAGRHAPRVVLTSRSGPDSLGAAVLAADLATAGTAAEVIACDVAGRAEVAGLLARIAATGPRLAGVLHAAGVLDDGLLDGMDAGRLASVVAAKAAGAAHLDELTKDADLEQFVLFSSAAATFGGAGQGNYAAANAFLDGLAQRRAALGLAGLSVAWGPWAGGMAQASDAARDRLRRGPLLEMDPALAIRALGQALAGHDSLLAVMDVDWDQFGATASPFVRELPEVARTVREAGAAAGPDLGRQELTRRLAGLPRARQVQVLADLVRGGAAGVLGHASPEAIEADRAFGDLGFDSLTSLEMRQHLSAVTGLKLPATLLFDYPTPAVLAAHLRSELLGDPAGDAAIPVLTAAPVAGEPIAIVGMSCRYPGGVRDPEGMWELLAAGTDAISGFPQDRGWDLEELYDPDPDHPGTSYSRHGGF